MYLNNVKKNRLKELKNMNIVDEIKQQLLNNVTTSVDNQKRFFKTTPGSYAENEKFLGVSMPKIRSIAKNFYDISLDDISALLKSEFNEIRMLALIILVDKYNKTNEKEAVFNLYLNNTNNINNWNLVDVSAHLIVGKHLLNKDKKVLLCLASSKILWERRIAIVSTWYFIKNNFFDSTIEIALILLKDKHDLIHKAVGWMLREMGKKNQEILVNFLEKYGANMPRTTLRYAIEKFSKEQQKKYLSIQQEII